MLTIGDVSMNLRKDMSTKASREGDDDSYDDDDNDGDDGD